VEYILRDAEYEDREFIYEIKKKYIYQYVEMLFGWDEEYQRSDFESDFVINKFQIISADDKSIGFIQTHENEYRIYIAEIHLIPEYQGQGIGSIIIKSINERALKGGKYVSAQCYTSNTRAQKLYESLGFAISESQSTDTHYVFQYRR
jgi:Acetyltransferases